MSACHDGFFQKYNIIHKREIIIFENKLVIRDYLNKKISNTKIRFYLFPGIKLLKEKNKFKTNDGYFINTNCNGGKILTKKVQMVSRVFNGRRKYFFGNYDERTNL